MARGIRLRAGKVAKYKPRDVYINFAQSVRGIPPVHFLARAFHSSQAQAYHRQRVAEMGQDIRALVRGAA